MSRTSTRAANDTDDDLWLVPPDRFVAARNTLAAQKGDAAIKKLKRPTPSAWLVNVLVHTARRDVERVFHAGDALHAAQGRVLAGANPKELHDATRAVRDAVAAAMKRARAILSENERKPTADLIRRVTHTLRSAAIDKRLREVVEQGHLIVDPANDDLDELTDVAVKPAPTRGAKKDEKAKRHAKQPKRHAKEPKRHAKEPKRHAKEPKRHAKEPKRHAKKKEAAAENRRAAEEARAEKKRTALENKRAIAEAKREAREKRAREAREAKERLMQEAQAAEATVEDARREVMKREADERRARAALEDAQRAVAHARTTLKKSREAGARARKRRR